MEYELEHNKTYIFERYSGQTTIRSAGTSNRFQLTEAQSDLVSRIKNLDVRQYVFMLERGIHCVLACIHRILA